MKVSCCMEVPCGRLSTPLSPSCSECCCGATLEPATPRRRHQQLQRQQQRQEPWNPYHVLRVPDNASPSDILNAYKSLSVLYHPSRDDSGWFTAIAAAYETLSDPPARQRLDHSLLTKERRFRKRNKIRKPSRTQTDDCCSMDSLWLTCCGGRVDTFDDNTTTTRTQLTRIATSDDLSERHHRKEQRHDPETSSRHSPPRQERQVRPRNSLLVVASQPSSEAELHYSELDTLHLFGGPLFLMYQARQFATFTDPYAMFERVFESSLGTHYPLRRLSSIDCPFGYAKVMDGPNTTTTTSVVSKHETHVQTMRLRHNRVLTRTVKRVPHHTTVSVVSHELDDQAVVSPPWRCGECRDDAEEHDCGSLFCFTERCCG